MSSPALLWLATKSTISRKPMSALRISCPQGQLTSTHTSRASSIVLPSQDSGSAFPSVQLVRGKDSSHTPGLPHSCLAVKASSCIAQVRCKACPSVLRTQESSLPVTAGGKGYREGNPIAIPSSIRCVEPARLCFCPQGSSPVLPPPGQTLMCCPEEVQGLLS